MNNQNLRPGRPRRQRRIRFNHKVNYYKPQGIPLRNLKVEKISVEELEALRLKNVKDLNQDECAQKMNISQSTFQRVLSEAYKKISDALISGKAIKIIRN